MPTSFLWQITDYSSFFHTVNFVSEVMCPALRHMSWFAWARHGHPMPLLGIGHGRAVTEIKLPQRIWKDFPPKRRQEWRERYALLFVLILPQTWNTVNKNVISPCVTVILSLSNNEPMDEIKMVKRVQCLNVVKCQTEMDIRI